MNIVESFMTKQIRNENLASDFQLIMKTITLSNSKNVMEKQLKNYINYLATKVDIDFKVNAFEDDKKLKNNQMIETNLKNNSINVNLKLFQVTSVEDFVKSANLLAVATQRLKINQLGNYYSTQNKNGFRGEYALHLDDLNAISKFVNENTVFDVGDKNIFRIRTNAVKYLDDQESAARQFGINAQFEIFETLDQMGVLQNYFDESLEKLKFNINKKEISNFNTYFNILNETDKDNQQLLEKIKNTAIIQKNPKIILHLADLLDMREFYSSKCFVDLTNYAEKNKNLNLFKVLANCKQSTYAVVTAPKRENIVQENLKNNSLPQNIKNDFQTENSISQNLGTKVEFSITEPYKDEKIKVNAKSKQQAIKDTKASSNFVLEKRTVEKTKDGKTLETSIYGHKKDDKQFLGMSEDASRYVKHIWEDKEK